MIRCRHQCGKKWSAKKTSTLFLVGLLVTTTSCSASHEMREVSETDIVNALPDPLPPGWTATGSTDTGFSLASTTGGACGGPNALQKALDGGATARVSYPWLRRADLVLERWFLVEVYAFPSEDSARDFVDAGLEVVSRCPSYEFTALESEVNGFQEGDYDDAEWLATSTWDVTDSDLLGEQSRFMLTVETDYSFTADGSDYSLIRTAYESYAAFGTVVIATMISQQHGFSGYADSDDDPGELLIAPGDLRPLDQLVMGIRKRLGM